MDAKLQALNQIALKNGFKDWNDLWWRGDITVDIMEDALDAYGKQMYDAGYRIGFHDYCFDINKETNGQ